MSPLVHRAGYAALVIFAAFCMHTLNALYIEPNYLGFREYTDYADVDKLRHAMGSVPWMLSGWGHFLSGFAAVYLALAGRELFREHKLVPARIAMGAGLLSATGFMLTGIANLVGGQALELLSAANPELERSAYLASSLMRIAFNCLAQVGLGWYAVLVSWCGQRTGLLPRAFCYFGYLSGLSGVLMGVAYVPVYLYLVLVWAVWYGSVLLRLPPSPATAAAA